MRVRRWGHGVGGILGLVLRCETKVSHPISWDNLDYEGNDFFFQYSGLSRDVSSATFSHALVFEIAATLLDYYPYFKCLPRGTSHIYL